jgi:hypothetical protein
MTTASYLEILVESWPLTVLLALLGPSYLPLGPGALALVFFFLALSLDVIMLSKLQVRGLLRMMLKVFLRSGSKAAAVCKCRRCRSDLRGTLSCS